MEDFLIEIFSRLPAKSLLRFQCISKSSKSLVSNPVFVKLHLLNSRKNTNLLLEFTRSLKTLSLVHYSLCTIVEDFNFRSKLSSNFKFEVVGSCNGLVCLLACEDYKVCLWNPITITMSKSYQPCLLFRRYGSIPMVGFGYDSFSDTYKVVVVSFDRDDLYGRDLTQSEAMIYNNRDDCWKNIQNFPGFPVSGRTHGIYLNDTIHWVATSVVDYYKTYPSHIVSLHLGNETYKQSSLPSCFDRVKPTLGILKDHLCFSYEDINRTHFVLWQMNEYGVESSWTQLLKLSMDQESILPPLGTFKNDHLILIERIDGKLQATIVYGQEGNIEIPSNELWVYTKEYVPSLIAP